MAVDYGKKNIGLACSDPLGLTVRPLLSMPNLGRKNFLANLRRQAAELGAEELVLGIPFNMDGTRGEPALEMERLMNAISSALDLPVAGADERLSTVEATELWRDMSPKQQKRYRTVDSLAAALILERYLGEG